MKHCAAPLRNVSRSKQPFVQQVSIYSAACPIVQVKGSAKIACLEEALQPLCL
ncbi:hypothetical protein ACQ4M4_01370 [Leptolyngbya sp. AN02str]|uniref:hypothetical protein n=1 Tax=Leptolyngbya sp. AN02str TaxID=3423363 RepID=UPI003D31A2A5